MSVIDQEMASQGVVDTTPAVKPIAPAGSKPWSLKGPGGRVTAAQKQEGQLFAREILSSQAYRDQLRRQADTGTLSAPIEAMLWSYAYGKPHEHIEVSVTHDDINNMSVAELLERTKILTDQLAEAQALEDAIPAQYKIT